LQMYIFSNSCFSDDFNYYNSCISDTRLTIDNLTFHISNFVIPLTIYTDIMLLVFKKITKLSQFSLYKFSYVPISTMEVNITFDSSSQSF